LGYQRLSLRRVIRNFAVSYLLLNLGLATIPRCDSVFYVLQLLHEAGTAQELTQETMSRCHTENGSKNASLQVARVCECALVKFVSVKLPDFDIKSFIVFQIQSVQILSFAAQTWHSEPVSGPEPPPPRV
jgi:hypothetical protein